MRSYATEPGSLGRAQLTGNSQNWSKGSILNPVGSEPETILADFE
jgi:hypothetical protein